MIQISKERLYEMALDSISNEVSSIYDLIDEDKLDRWMIDSIATIGGTVRFALKIVKEGEIKENE